MVNSSFSIGLILSDKQLRLDLEVNSQEHDGMRPQSPGPSISTILAFFCKASYQVMLWLLPSSVPPCTKLKSPSAHIHGPGKNLPTQRHEPHHKIREVNLRPHWFHRLHRSAPAALHLYPISPVLLQAAFLLLKIAERVECNGIKLSVLLILIVSKYKSYSLQANGIPNSRNPSFVRT